MTADRKIEIYIYVSVLAPFKGRRPPEVEVESKSPMGQVGDVRLRWADGTEDEVHWGCNFGLMLGSSRISRPTRRSCTCARMPPGRLSVVAASMARISRRSTRPCGRSRRPLDSEQTTLRRTNERND
jgi:hypothetical protein